MVIDILKFDSGNRTIGLYIGDSSVGDSSVGDDGVDMCYVVLGLEELDGFGSVGVHSMVDLQDEEGAGWTDGKAGEGFNAGMRRVADRRNHVIILTGEVDRYETEANAYGGRLSCQLIFPGIYDLACQVLIGAGDQVDGVGCRLALGHTVNQSRPVNSLGQYKSAEQKLSRASLLIPQGLCGQRLYGSKFQARQPPAVLLTTSADHCPANGCGHDAIDEACLCEVE